jgi:hypothetical protein
MRYYGLISFRHAFVAIGLALTVSASLHLGAIVNFIEREGTLLSELHYMQTAAQMAAFRHLVSEPEKCAEFDAR